MLHHNIHSGTSDLILQICKFNHVAFHATVLYPYQRRNLNTGIFEYRTNAFVRLWLLSPKPADYTVVDYKDEDKGSTYLCM